MRRVEKLPAALRDLEDLAAYIALDSPMAAERFLLNAEATFDALAAFPGLGHRRMDLDPPFNKLRSLAVRGFPNHLVFYRQTTGAIIVVRLYHSARDLGNLDFTE